ncbi:MAG: hypothetical protein ACE362_19030 [Phaeodactylibacter xiamenensis]|uniref:Uncharacterized protein n=1 Tax=Phaeodactylibacter xiamenensis TaxID=1524460 RepID=A0A098S4K2_9BACT|nr:hypothetical protein [Phaeodactylibacter xiamenensis]KGE87269.1 hypothetical protein IX84_16645 [Phaeodactylibacter xiamenensis]
MKNKFLLLTWLLAVPLLWVGCDKPLFKPDRGSIAQPNELPPITTTGEGNFACKINGVNWQRCGGGFLQSSILGNWSPNYKIFQISGMRRSCEGFDDSVYIAAYVDSVGRYSLHDAFYNDRNHPCQESSDPSRLLEGADNWVEILNLDTDEFIVSGTFQCTVVDDNCGDTLFITDGRFDYDWAN